MADQRRRRLLIFLIGAFAAAAICFLGLIGAGIWAAHNYFDRAKTEIQVAPATRPVRGVLFQITDQNSQPIAGAVVARGNDIENLFDKEFAADSSGQCEIPFVNQGGEAAIISAKGYMAAAIPIQSTDDGAIKNIALAPSRKLTGRVLDQLGSPVAGVTILLIGSGSWASIGPDDGKLEENSQKPSRFQKSSSDADGNYSLEQLSASCLLVAYCDKGIAEIRDDALASPQDIHLADWGRIESQLFDGGKPGANRTMWCSANNPWNPIHPDFSFGSAAQTDSQGHFVFGRVAPGKMRVAKVYMQKFSRLAPYQRATQEEAVTAVSGQTVTVTVGQTGRPVVGRLILPPDMANQNYFIFGFARPEVLTAKGTPERGPGPSYFLEVAPAPDRTFVMNDVQPGRYHILVQLRDSRDWVNDGKTRVEADFTMPEIPGGHSDEPLKLPDMAFTTQ